MKAYEFPGKVTADGKLELPPLVKGLLSADQTVRILILVDEPTEADEEGAWYRLTAEQFLAGYSEADAIYDELEP